MSDAADPAPKKRPPISLTFLVTVCVLGLLAYYSGPWIMTRVLYLQEKMKASSGAIPQGAPEGRPSLPSGGEDGGGGGGGGGGGRGNFDPEARFAQLDADSNGQLEGDEVDERMRDRLDSIDTDEDGAVSKEEFLTAIESMRARRGRGGGQRPERPAGEGSDDAAATDDQSVVPPETTDTSDESSDASDENTDPAEIE